MGHQTDTGQAIENAILEDRPSGCALLCALLDSEILFDEKEVPVKELTPLWNLYCSECSPEEEAEDLGLPFSSDGETCGLPDNGKLAGLLSDRFSSRRLKLPKGAVTLDSLLDDFTDHCKRELGIEIDQGTATWGGRCFSSSGRRHHVLIRPRPVLLRAHPHAFILLLSPLPVTGIDAIIDLFVEIPGLRQRLAIVDLENGFKINLTRSDVFVHFERHLRRMYGLRLVVHPELTQGLVDGGIMKLEKG